MILIPSQWLEECKLAYARVIISCGGFLLPDNPAAMALLAPLTSADISSLISMVMGGLRRFPASQGCCALACKLLANFALLPPPLCFSAIHAAVDAGVPAITAAVMSRHRTLPAVLRTCMMLLSVLPLHEDDLGPVVQQFVAAQVAHPGDAKIASYLCDVFHRILVDTGKGCPESAVARGVRAERAHATGATAALRAAVQQHQGALGPKEVAKAQATLRALDAAGRASRGGEKAAAESAQGSSSAGMGGTGGAERRTAQMSPGSEEYKVQGELLE